MSVSQHAGPKVACLSLDGGGVRALSQLLILKRLIEIVAQKSNPEHSPKPCECFQLIGGSGTGGLLAILLGHLEMGIDECIAFFHEVVPSIFGSKKSFRNRLGINALTGAPRFDTQRLEAYLKDVISRSGRESDALFHNTEAQCKVFVTATSAESGNPVVFTNYTSQRRSRFEDVKIWEAARATLAASTFFEPVKIGPYRDTFVDGSLGGNNPIRTLWTEMRDLWKDEAQLSCLLSLGTGRQALQPLGGVGNYITLIRSLAAIATETEQTAESFAREHEDLIRATTYFRFNVEQGLEDVGFTEYESSSKIEAATRRYLASERIWQNVLRCSENLAGRHVPHVPLLGEPEPERPIAHQGSFEVDPLGLTVISPKDEHATVEVDLIAVHGSTGGSYSTWRNQRTGARLLHDLLPQDLPSIRIMTYGHSLEEIRSARNDKSTTQASGRLFDIASNLLNDLDDNRIRRYSTRPLIFLCHGIGGIIVKKALVIASTTPSQYVTILPSVIHVIFFDTPHRGYDTRILKTISDGSLAKEFSLWSNVLRELNTEFGELAERIWLTSFFANLPPTAIEEELPMMVEQASSILGFRKERSVMLENTTHATICQFSGPRDRNYARLKARIENVILVKSSDLSFKVIDGCMRSVSFKTMGDEVCSTHAVLRELVKSLSEIKLDEDDVEKLIELARQCRDILIGMDEYLRLYSKRKSGEAGAAEIRYKLEELRKTLKYRTALLHRFYTDVMLRTASTTSEQRDIWYRQMLGRIEEKLDKLTQHMENTKGPRKVDVGATDEAKESSQIPLPDAAAAVTKDSP